MSIYTLYVKTHKTTGLKYLGQTKQNPYVYLGSGIYWRKHLLVHGTDHNTEIIKECETKEDIKVWGEYYSKLWNVVESNEWANLKLESGEGGAYFGHRMTAKSRTKMSVKAKNRVKHKCPHCNTVCSGSNYTRWHGDNCKTQLSGLIEREKHGQQFKVEKIQCIHCGKESLPSRHNKNHGDNCSKNPERIKQKEERRQQFLADRPLLKCIHCGITITNKTNFGRWHGDNCKLFNNHNETTLQPST